MKTENHDTPIMAIKGNLVQRHKFKSYLENIKMVTLSYWHQKPIFKVIILKPKGTRNLLVAIKMYDLVSNNYVKNFYVKHKMSKRTFLTLAKKYHSDP